MMPAAVGPGEQRILATERHRAHGLLDNVGVQFQATVIEKPDQAIPMIESVTNCLRQGGATGQAVKQVAQPNMHRLDQRTAALLAHPLAMLGRLAADFGLDRIQSGDPLQRLVGQRRFRGDVDIVTRVMSFSRDEGLDRLGRQGIDLVGDDRCDDMGEGIEDRAMFGQSEGREFLDVTDDGFDDGTPMEQRPVEE